MSLPLAAVGALFVPALLTTGEPFIAATLAAAALLYAAGLHALWRRAGSGRGVRPWRAASFAGGTLVLAAALLTPLSEAAETRLSWHMIQHELIMLAAAPLLVFGRPLFVSLWSLPASWRRTIARAFGARPIASGWHIATQPLTAFLIYAGILWTWHLPALYQAALEHEVIHAAQHASFLAAACLFWWGMVYGRYGRIGYGVAVVFVFLTVLHSGLLGALMTVAPAPWYPAYANVGTADPLADQQLAGLIMWVPSGLVLIALGLALFAAWLADSVRRTARG